MTEKLISQETRVLRRGMSPAAVLFAALFAAQAAILVLSPILPQVAAEFGVSTASAAQLRSVSGLTAGVLALVLAATGQRFSLSSLLYGGLGIIGFGALVSAVAPTFVVLLLAQMVIGAGLAAVISGGLAASETWAASGESAKVLSWALIGQPIAWVVGQPLVGLVAGRDWRWAWVAVPLASSVMALVALGFRDRTVGDQGQDCDPIGLWKQAGMKWWAVGELLAFAAWAGTLVYAGAVFIESYSLSVGTTGLVLGAGALFYLPGNALGRRLLDKDIGPVIAGFSVIAAVGVTLFLTTSANAIVAFLLFTVAVFFAAGRTIAGAAMGLQISDGRRLAAMSVRTAAAQFGYLLGAGLGGVLLETWGFAGAGWGFGILFIAGAAVHLPRLLSGRGSLGTAGRFLRRSRPTASSSGTR
ncbi:MAG TPA: MFS transporter [Acidimicrobiia bacterium]